jgi:hypothetical protein
MQRGLFLMFLVTLGSALGAAEDGLVAHYPFDEELSSVEVKDLSGNGRDGRTNASPDEGGLPIEQSVGLPKGATSFRLMNRKRVDGREVKVTVTEKGGAPTELVDGRDFEVSGSTVKILNPDITANPVRALASYHYFNESVEREEGIRGNALKIDGNNDWVQIPNVEGLDFVSGITIAMWVRPDKQRAPIEVLISGAGVWGLSFYEDALAFHHQGIPQGIPADRQRTHFKNFKRPDGSDWVHVAVTADGNETRLYVDGVEVEVVSDRPGEIPAISSGELRIGGMNEYVYNGLLDDVRIYKRPLNPEEIAGLAKR